MQQDDTAGPCLGQNAPGDERSVAVAPVVRVDAPEREVEPRLLRRLPHRVGVKPAGRPEGARGAAGQLGDERGRVGQLGRDGLLREILQIRVRKPVYSQLVPALGENGAAPTKKPVFLYNSGLST